MLALAVLSVALLAVVSSATVGQQHLMAADHAMAASRLARDLLEEISARPFQDPDQTPVFGKEAGEATRAAFDDCDDYNGYAEAQGQARNGAGALYPDNQSVFSRRVTVVPETRTIAALGASVPGVRATVEVEDKHGQKWQYTRFIPQPPQ
jgi:hypothetical protein